MSALSVTVITLNEERNLAACLETVSWADELVVVDSGSNDGTVALARQLGARVLARPFTNYAEQKNAALHAATGDWVLSLDADERLTPELAEEIRQAIGKSGDTVGYYLLRREHMLGQWIRYGQWGPAYKLRLIRRGRGQWQGAVHELLAAHGPTAYLRAPFLHYTGDDIASITRKTDRYTTLEAQAWHAAGVRPSLWKLVCYPPALFLYSYIIRRGFLDGAAGLVLAMLMAYYTFLKRAKLWELYRRTA